MAADFTPEEIAVRAVTPAWTQLPVIAAKADQVRAAVAGHAFDAAGMTAALQAFNAGPAVPDVHQALAAGLL